MLCFLWLHTGSHTKADSTDVRSRYSDSERGSYSDHEVDYVHPVIIWRDVCVAYAAGIINDERNVQQTSCCAKYNQILLLYYNLHDVTANWKSVTANERHCVLLTGNDNVNVKVKYVDENHHNCTTTWNLGRPKHGLWFSVHTNLLMAVLGRCHPVCRTATLVLRWL